MGRRAANAVTVSLSYGGKTDCSEADGDGGGMTATTASANRTVSSPKKLQNLFQI